jgi:CubicO group peptidase (beta-lactamase class C family)
MDVSRQTRSYVPAALILGSLGAFRAGAAAQTADTAFSAVDSVVVSEMRAAGVPGAAVAVLNHGRLVYSRGYGVLDVESGRPVTAATLFRIASTTKMMTAAALVTLELRGSLSLHAPVGRYVAGLSPCVAPVSVGQLLSHTAGIADSASEHGPHDEAARGRWVREWPCARAFLPAGRFFSYSNLGYDLAGEVLQARYGSYAGAMDSLLFRPLGMRRTTLRPTVALTYPLALGHVGGTDGAAVIARPAGDDAREWPAGGVFTSVEDYARFLAALLGRGRLDGRRLLPETLFDSLVAPRAPQLDTRPERRAFIGWGFNVRDAGGYRVVQHAGSMLGYGSVVRIIPEDGFAVVLLANRSGAVLSRSMARITELVTGRPSPPPLPAPRSLAMGPAEQDRYVGTYGSGTGYLTLTLFRRGASLYLRQLGAQDSSLVEKAGVDSFVTEGTYLAISPGAAGRPEFMHVAGHTLRREPPARPVRRAHQGFP